MMQTLAQIDLGQRANTLSVLASMQNREVNSLLLEAVDSYLTNETERLAYEQNAIASYHHYQETGLHTTPSEMMAWAESLGTKNPMELPSCHQ